MSDIATQTAIAKGVAAIAGPLGEEIAARPRDGWVRRWTVRELLGIHEAAHIVARLAIGIPTDFCTIEAPGNMWAITEDGSLAQITGFTGSYDGQEPIDADNVRFGKSCGLIGGDAEGGLRAAAEQILVNNWPLLMDLASALWVDGTIRGEQISRIAALHPVPTIFAEFAAA